MIKNFYQKELSNLRELAAEFSGENPALAPMLAAKGDDPDVERLLEGVAFLSALVRQRLEEGFPELIEALLRLVDPEALLPVPSGTMVRFGTVRGFMEAVNVPKGTELASVPVDGARAVFTTSRSVAALPAVVSKCQLEETGPGNHSLTLTVSSASPVGRWLPETLPVYFAGDYNEASERRRILLSKTRELLVGAKGRETSLGKGAELGARGILSPGPFADPGDDSFGSRDWRGGFSVIRDYFAMPQKFLFMDLGGFKSRLNPGDSEFVLTFRLKDIKGRLPGFRADDFALSVCPAENVFDHPAIPIRIDHRKSEYLIVPQDRDHGRKTIFRVGKVSGVTKDGVERAWLPFERLPDKRPGDGAYSLFVRRSPISGVPEHYLRLIYEENEDPAPETLSVNLKCYNRGLSEQLRTGEINRPTDSSPAMTVFANLTAPTRHGPGVSDDGKLWKLLSRLHANLMSSLSARTLREVLLLHSVDDDPDVGRSLSNLKRINALSDVRTEKEDYFFRGIPIRGTKITVEADSAGFGSQGDLRLLGDALDVFFGHFHHLNSYTRLSVVEKNSREESSWPPRLGTRRLV
ncbi:MAG: type VI secretion system baseplate subunit TssF [Deltaproteobacteria bacterium]|nr:type VI secretion system baseplate subunit TssF [Deltaproteobacteria bacterium]